LHWEKPSKCWKLLKNGVVVVSGILGSLLGSALADLLKNRIKQSYFSVSALGALLASIACTIGLHSPNYILSICFIYILA